MALPCYAPEPHMLGWLQCFMLPSDIILDVGSGDGRYRHVGGKEYYSLDSWLPSQPDYLMDLNKSDLPTDRKFSVIMLLDILEHMDRDNGKRILQNAIDIATRAVIVYTPLIWSDNHVCFKDVDSFFYRNEHILHKSLWNLEDFQEPWVRVFLPSTKDVFFGYRV